ncbi:hypothetical protein TNCV_3820521 [Trichonephila clavipes]|nr:hypothetical protein TNCV_3820521 [Trichonephila clavipes]
MTSNLNIGKKKGTLRQKKKVAKAFYLWLIVGCSVGGVLLLTLFVALLIYIRRRIRRSKKGSDLLDSSYIPGSEFCPQQM